MQLSISLRPEAAEFIVLKARESNMTPEALASTMLTSWALAASKNVPAQVAAEQEYWRVLHAIADRYAKVKDWDEDITRKVFEEIEREHRDLYERVIGGDAYETGNPIKHRINKETASRIKTALKAEVHHTVGGHPVRGSVSRGLISAYTKLFSE